MKYLSYLMLTGAVALARPVSAGETTVLYGGKVFTSDPAQPWATSVAIHNNTIIYVGSDANALRLGGPKAKRINLQGRLVIPGLNDAHVHIPIEPPGVHIDTGNFIPGPGPDAAFVLDQIQQAAETTPPGTWIFGVVGTGFIEDPRCNRFEIDAVAPNHPVKLMVWAGHGTIINTAAMRVVGIAEDQADPLGGSYERDGAGQLTGVLHEYAETAVRRYLTMITPVDSARAQIAAFSNAVAQFGVTSLQDIPFGLTQARVDEIYRNQSFNARLRTICFPLTLDESCDTRLTSDPTAMVRATGVKWINDGSPIERYAAVRAPYADRPDWTGVFNFPTGAVQAYMRDVMFGNPITNQLLVHGVGDRAIDTLIASARSVAPDFIWRGRRLRLEHGDMLLPSHITAMRSLGAVLVQNPLHFAIPDLLEARFGAERMSTIQPLRSVVEAGVPLAIGSDTVTGPGNPYLDLMFAVIHPSQPSEGITLEQAVRAYTLGSAYAEFAELRKGSLTIGKLADLAVLSQDIFTAPIFSLPGTTSVLTMVNGRVVFDAGVVH